VQRESDEEAWRAIVENYGARAELDDDDPAADPGAGPDAPEGYDATDGAALRRLFRPLPEARPDALEPDGEDEDEDAFVPPPPPPAPKLPPDRLLAWLGLFGSPTVLLVCLVLNVGLPSWLGYLLVASFIGGFVYLVAKMPRGTDIDPWDDGARL
jgi:hypothetical protein